MLDKRDLNRGRTERDSARKDHESDRHRDGRVSVEPVLAVQVEDERARDHDADVVDRVADDVQEHAKEAEVAVQSRGWRQARVVVQLVLCRDQSEPSAVYRR